MQDRHKRLLVIAGTIVALAIIWLLRPSPYTRVRNLDSRGTNIIAFGDSLTAGYGAGPGDDYPSQLSKLIDRPIINAGVSGDTTESALERVEKDVLARDPRIVIIGLGGNDLLRGIAISTTEENLRAIVGKIHDGGAMVVLIRFDFPSFTADYGKMYDRIAADTHCLLVSGVFNGILRDASLRSDEIHPNAKGYALMAERLAPPLRKLIKAGESSSRSRSASR